MATKDDEPRDWLVLEGSTQSWWGPNRGGYRALQDAGLYTKAEALAIQDFSDRYGRRDKAVHVSERADKIELLYQGAKRLYDAMLAARTAQPEEPR